MYFWLKQKTMFRTLIILFLFMPLFIKAQVDTNQPKKVKFSEDFRFTDGVFMNIEDVKRNNPIPKARIITDVNYDDYSFFNKVLDGELFYVLDNMGQKQELKVKDIWGFSQNGMLFVSWNGEFNRIPVFGSVCHFIADKTVIDDRNSPYYNSYNYYYNPYYYPNNQTVKKELRQYLIDMETGKVMDYNYKNLEAVIIRDTELYEEFAKLKNKKKRQLKFLYLRKYNERNPFYFIVN